MKEEGVIKFNCHWIKSDPVTEHLIKDLNDWRNTLYHLGLIGVTEEGVGYGNISIRYQQHTFLITGSGTGKFQHLTPHHYTLVTDYHIEQNTLTTQGPIQASSESLTHAIIYQCEKAINAVLHVHHFALWQKLLKTLPSTHSQVEYGTPAMAAEVARLFRETPLSQHKIFAMGGHEAGIVAFGKDLAEAGGLLLAHYASL